MTATVPPVPPTGPDDRPIGPGPAGHTSDPSGRVELAPGAVPDDSRFVNDDLLPVPLERRRWTTYNFAALWIGMAHNIPSWLLASGLVALGMDWKQAVLTIALA
ncbi:MAG TPA: nitrate reductase, partial [Streptomyces sp.]|nr:nitrate reductase [Streptomyces sp.]